MKTRKITANSILYVTLSLVLSLLTNCENDNEPDAAKLLIGKWENTEINHIPIVTDSKFVMELKSDNKELYARGFKLDENNESWEENNSYTYSVQNNILTIDGKNVLGNLFHMEFETLTLNQSVWTYSVKSFLIDGVSYPDAKIYTCKRVTKDYSQPFTGIWYGRCTSEGTTDTKYHYWEYFSDGTYNYYYQDDNNKWIKKSDNEGRYFLYGTLFVSNYSNDLLSGGTGHAFECWDFSINGNTMTWTGLRENNKIVTYQMKKVSTPPLLNW
ncbi:MAG: hypothetical protein PHV66_08740 [Bacteroidales bacterium]|nr:hypothetical protein [Bacteroidales bacterium]